MEKAEGGNTVEVPRFEPVCILRRGKTTVDVCGGSGVSRERGGRETDCDRWPREGEKRENDRECERVSLGVVLTISAAT